MARDYVTIRQTGTEAEPVWTESVVGRVLLKSAPVRVIRNGETYRIEGASWGRLMHYMEVKIDDGPWQRGRLHTSQGTKYAWSFWTFNWANPTVGEHTITTRAVDASGQVQPAQDDPLIANKITYWESNGQITRRVEIPE
jgi:hypothetical protein